MRVVHKSQYQIATDRFGILLSCLIPGAEGEVYLQGGDVTEFLSEVESYGRAPEALDQLCAEYAHVMQKPAA